MIAPTTPTDADRAHCIEVLAQPIADREREFYPHCDGAMLLDDSGGQPVERFDDATAVHYFLIWLRAQRAQSVVRMRRRSMVVVRCDRQGGQDHE